MPNCRGSESRRGSSSILSAPGRLRIHRRVTVTGPGLAARRECALRWQVARRGSVGKAPRPSRHPRERANPKSRLRRRLPRLRDARKLECKSPPGLRVPRAGVGLRGTHVRTCQCRRPRRVHCAHWQARGPRLPVALLVSGFVLRGSSSMRARLLAASLRLLLSTSTVTVSSRLLRSVSCQ